MDGLDCSAEGEKINSLKLFFLEFGEQTFDEILEWGYEKLEGAQVTFFRNNTHTRISILTNRFEASSSS